MPNHVFRTAAQTAWFYNDGKYANLAGTTIKQPETVGKTQETQYPAGGFSWSIPTAGVGFQRAGVLQAAAHLQENNWIDYQTRYVELVWNVQVRGTAKMANL